MTEEYNEKYIEFTNFMEVYKITPTMVKTLPKIDDWDRFIIKGTREGGLQYTVLMTTQPDGETRLSVVNKYWYDKEAGAIMDVEVI